MARRLALWWGVVPLVVSLDAGPLLTIDKTYAEAETLLTRAIAEIGSAGGALREAKPGAAM